jgi:hypothetical protein
MAEDVCVGNNVVVKCDVARMKTIESCYLTKVYIWYNMDTRMVKAKIGSHEIGSFEVCGMKDYNQVVGCISC